MTKTSGFRNRYGALSVCSGVALGAYSVVHFIHIFDSDPSLGPNPPGCRPRGAHWHEQEPPPALRCVSLPRKLHR